tara:strand:- start:1373 stop:2389 length:1017 start_codon:yes stop_codon:yes gene_type:complete
MRLIDGNPDIIVPPGEGKLQILRRFASKPMINNLKSMDVLDIFSEIQLDLNNVDKKRFLKFLKVELRKNSSVNNLHQLVWVLINTILNFREEDDKITKKKSWLEKNHNIEFYFGRAKQLFPNSKLIFVARDPRDVWISWKKYCLLHGLKNDLDQARCNLQFHAFDEIIEMSYGVKRFKQISDLIKYYNIKRTSFLGLENVLKKNGVISFVNENIISMSNFDEIDTNVGRFSWNYFCMLDRAVWLEKTFKNDVMILKYEDLVERPEAKIKEVLHFCDLSSKNTLIMPSENNKEWVSNSSFFKSKTNKISKSSVGKWKFMIADKEASIINKIAGNIYTSI